jgi:hypothetical protein
MEVIIQNPAAVRAQKFWLPTDDLTNGGWEEIPIGGMAASAKVLVPDWEAGREYCEFQLAANDGALYRCKQAHESSVVFASDAIRWELLGGSNAKHIKYDNPAYTNVASALDKLFYEPIEINFSIFGNTVFEIGIVTAEINLVWSYNKEIVSQSINNGIGILSTLLRSFSHSGQAITGNITYTLTASDGIKTASANATIQFLPKRYWGVHEADVLTNTQILNMEQEFAANRNQQRIFDCSGGAGKYFYIIYPASFGAANITVGGFSYSGYELETRNVVNAQGYTQQYHIYRSGMKMTGSAIHAAVN